MWVRILQASLINLYSGIDWRWFPARSHKPIYVSSNLTPATKYIAWFSEESAWEQRRIIAKLEEIFQIQNNFGYIDTLKSQIKQLNNKIIELKEANNNLLKDIKSDVKYKQALQRIGELESYIAELEDRPVSVDALYLNIPKEERKEIKVKVCEEYTYKLLVQRQKDLEQRLKQSRDSYENLLLSYIKLVNQKDKN